MHERQDVNGYVRYLVKYERGEKRYKYFKDLATAVGSAAAGVHPDGDESEADGFSDAEVSAAPPTDNDVSSAGPSDAEAEVSPAAATDAEAEVSAAAATDSEPKGEVDASQW